MGEIEHFFYCPYCGENISMLIDLSFDNQKYVEDCEVCCKPIEASRRQSSQVLQGPRQGSSMPLDPIGLDIHTLWYAKVYPKTARRDAPLSAHS